MSNKKKKKKIDAKVEVNMKKPSFSMVFIGHLDAGKSTIFDTIMTKFKQEAKENGRDSWWFAYVMDRREHAQGKTVEVG
jgi:peptide chain release factor subunit 3